ncbi:MAG: hypothetical protein R3C03_20275 [Pirellulaceae bacterium]
MAQYSALMVMEHEYGRDMMRKFLGHELDSYLSARGKTTRAERPLFDVEMDQGYVHYNKGSVAMYQLKETIGEERVNAALRSLVDQFGYAEPPYPTSLDLIDALRQQTPAEHQGLIDDLFMNITLFENRTTAAEVEKMENGKYQVTIEAEFKKFHADSLGEQTEQPLDDWIEIGAFAKPSSANSNPSKRAVGKLLHREQVHITESPCKFTFTTDELPDLVGIDPISLLVDRNKKDDMRPAELKGEAK